MAEEEGGKKYYLIKEDGTQTENSRGYYGRGTAFYPNGEIYEGEYEDGQRRGIGSYTYLSGDKYEGEWVANEKHGTGKMVYVKEGEYFGRFENGKRHGEGIFTYKNKDIFSGQWEYGKKKGRGTYYYDETRMKLSGKWENGIILEGDWIFPNGTFFRGKFKGNKPEGSGEWHFTNGNKVKGDFAQTPIEDTDPVQVKLSWTTFPNIVDYSKV